MITYPSATDTPEIQSRLYKTLEEDPLVDELQYEGLVEYAQQRLIDDLVLYTTWVNTGDDVFDEFLQTLHDHWIGDQIFECDVVADPHGESEAHPDHIMDAALNVREALMDELNARRDWIMGQVRKTMQRAAQCIVIRVKRTSIEVVDIHTSDRDARNYHPNRP